MPKIPQNPKPKKQKPPLCFSVLQKEGYHPLKKMILSLASIAVFQKSPASLFFFPRGVIGLVLFCVIIMYLGRELFLVYSAAGSFLYWKIVVIH